MNAAIFDSDQHLVKLASEIATQELIHIIGPQPAFDIKASRGKEKAGMVQDVPSIWPIISSTMVEKAGCFLAGRPNAIESIIQTEVTEGDAAKRSEKESTFSCKTAGCFLDQ